MNVFVKYSSKKPHLPVAVADSRNELAEMLGTTYHCVECGLKRNSTYAMVDIGDISEVIPTYPDNDGGLWYKDPDTGKTVFVRD